MALTFGETGRFCSKGSDGGAGSDRFLEWIPSDYVREFYRARGLRFTDYEWACIRWNQHIPRARKLEDLGMLARETEDEELKAAINNRLLYERECEKFFADSGEGKYIYTVLFSGEERPAGFFADPGSACAFGGKDEQRRAFAVEKQLVVTGEPPRVKWGERNPYLFPDAGEEWKEYEGEPVAGAEYRAGGILEDLWFAGGILSEGIRRLGDEWGTGGLNRAFPVEDPFERGDVVCLRESGKPGVVLTSREEWKRFTERMAQGIYCDYADCSSIMVLFLSREQGFSHGHPCIFELERVSGERPEKGRTEEERMIGLTAGFLRGEVAPDHFFTEYDRYRGI